MKPFQIGVTGGIGSGKSLICKIFQALGVPVYDADSRAKYVMTTDGILISDIKKEFGELSYSSDGSLNTSYISGIAFQDPARLKLLNKLVHPRVAADYEKWINEHVDFNYVIKEAALLFESGSYKFLDKVVVISAPEALRIERVLDRDKGRSEELIKKIIGQQWPEEEKVKRADVVIVNDETQMVIPQVLCFHESLSRKNDKFRYSGSERD